MACSTLSRARCFTPAASAAKPQRTVRVTVHASSSKPAQTASQISLPAAIKPAVATVVANVVMALPAAAESGKLFDFNLTLPIMIGEFLILMVFLDKFWFTPVGKVLDERDSVLRQKLGSVKDNSAELNKLAAEAEAVVKEARQEITALINGKKNEKQAELDKIYAEKKAQLQKEADAAIAELEKESETLLKQLDVQAEKISDEVLKRVLPAGVKL